MVYQLHEFNYFYPRALQSPQPRELVQHCPLNYNLFLLILLVVGFRRGSV